VEFQSCPNQTLIGAEIVPANCSSSLLRFLAHCPATCINLPCSYSTLGWVLEGGKAPVGLQGVRRVDGRSLGSDLGNLSFEINSVAVEWNLSKFISRH
jgi:hypothetical protein